MIFYEFFVVVDFSVATHDDSLSWSFVDKWLVPYKMVFHDGKSVKTEIEINKFFPLEILTSLRSSYSDVVVSVE